MADKYLANFPEIPDSSQAYNEYKELAKAVLDCYIITIKSICPPLNQLLHFGVRCPQRGFVFQGRENHAH